MYNLWITLGLWIKLCTGYPQVIHRLSTGAIKVIHRFIHKVLRRPQKPVTGFYTWGILGYQQRFLRVFTLWGLTSVWTYVGPYSWHSCCYVSLLYDARMRLARNDKSGQESKRVKYLRFTSGLICSLLHTWRDGDPTPPRKVKHHGKSNNLKNPRPFSHHSQA